MKLITWNIQWGCGTDGCVDLDRIVAHARRLADFDVLCLQEVSACYPDLPGNDGSDQFRALAERLPDYEAIPGPAVNAPCGCGCRRRFGNMILSRFPVMQVFPHLLPWPAEPGVRSMQRGALEATLDTPLGLIRVVCTHLEYYSVPQRLAQIERLRELHREAHAQSLIRHNGDPPGSPFYPLPRGSAAIVVGDMNFRHDSPEHARMTAPFDDRTPRLLDAWEVAHSEKPHAPTVGVTDPDRSDPPFVSDFVFVSDNLKPYVRSVRVDTETDASDHQPVLLELDYRGLPA